MEPIDAVVTWVDGSRPAHRLLRAWHHRAGRYPHEGNLRQRFDDHGELRYVLRSIVAHAPWIRRIHLVTNGQRPAWLADHPRLHVVTHTRIFPDRSHLPTFNANAIELHLHRIPGLPERFVYFNDDTFLGRNVTPETFFRGGAHMVLHSEHALPTGTPLSGDTGYIAALKNSAALLDARTGPKRRMQTEHTPRALLRSVFEEFHRTEPAAAARCSAGRFRSAADIAFVGCVHPELAGHGGRRFDGDADFRAICIRDDEAANLAGLDWLERNRPTLFCINDETESTQPRTWKTMRETLARMYPEASPLER